MSESSEMFVHSVPETGRLLPSASRWNSIEIDYGLVPPTSSSSYEFSISSGYSKSYNFHLTVNDKAHFKRFLYVATILLVVVVTAAVLLAVLLPRKDKDPGPAVDLPLALGHALLFFDAQKSGPLKNNPIKFRGDSGLNDVDPNRNNVSLKGGFYDSGNNIKFSFPTAYTVTLLSWSVIEYHQKYEEIGQIDHVMDIIKWGTDYLLKLVPSSDTNSVPTLIYSQVGSTDSNANSASDINCWQRPEDMTYARPVSTCATSASDLAGEITAALAAASLVLKQNIAYSNHLVQTAELLLQAAKTNQNKGTYTSDIACGGEARNFYNSTRFLDELAWGSTWLFFATGKHDYLQFATDTFEAAVKEATDSETRVFDWNNKIAANAVLLTRLRYLHDPGYPYEGTLQLSSEMTGKIMCSYLSPPKWMGLTSSVSPGGLIFASTNSTSRLMFPATAAFLSKLYSDYLNLIQVPGGSCDTDSFSPQMLRNFSNSQVNYILGDNPMKMSYLVGFGDQYPKQVHHRGASIPWDGQHHSCSEGDRWKESKDPNPNVLIGAMVGGPDLDDAFFDVRDQPKYTEPTIAGNAALVAALAALTDTNFGTNRFINIGGIDQDGMFANIT